MVQGLGFARFIPHFKIFSLSNIAGRYPMQCTSGTGCTYWYKHNLSLSLIGSDNVVCIKM